MTALHVFTGMGFLEYDSKIDKKRISSDYSGVINNIPENNR